MTGPHAGALDFLLKWYALPEATRQPEVSFQTLMAEAQLVADFLAKDTESSDKVFVWRWGQVTDETTGLPVAQPLAPRGDVMQLTDTQQVSFSIAAEDSKGNPVSGDTFTATVDNTAVVTVTGPDATTGKYTVAAVEPGVGAVLTVTDGAGITVTESFDVVAGSAATIALTFDDPTDEPAPAPVPVPDPTPTP